MKNTVATLAPSAGTRKLRDQALAAAIEIEKAEDGVTDFDREAITNLATALLKASQPAVVAGERRFLVPGYYGPLRRFATRSGAHRADSQGALDTVQSFTTGLAKDLRAFAGKRSVDPIAAARLIDYCLSLHSELIGDTSGREPRRRPSREPPSPSLRQA